MGYYTTVYNSITSIVYVLTSPSQAGVSGQSQTTGTCAQTQPLRLGPSALEVSLKHIFTQ